MMICGSIPPTATNIYFYMNNKIKNLLRLLLFLPLLLLLIIISIQPISESKPSVIIRFDDYGVWCNKDWVDIEEDVIKLHEKYNVKLTYGVIPDSRYPLNRHVLSPQVYPEKIDDTISNPYPLRGRRLEILKQSVKRGVVEIALHGYYHPKGYSNTDKNTEYYNVPYDTQYWKIKEGKLRLDSLFETNVTTFIPPHNTYDGLTLDFLQEFGFKCISAKMNSFDAPLDDRLSIDYLWYTSSSVPVFLNLMKKKFYGGLPVQILMLHHTSFTTDGVRDQKKIEEYEHLLKFINANHIPSFTFSDYPRGLSTNRELYSKVLLQRFIEDFQISIAAKILSIIKVIPVKIFVLLVLLSLMLAVYSIASFFKDLIGEKTLVQRLLMIGCIVLGVTIIALLYKYFALSSYNFHYMFISRRFILMLMLFAALLPWGLGVIKK